MNDLGGGGGKIENEIIFPWEGGRALEQEGDENLVHGVPRCEREGVCFSQIREQEGVGGPAVQPHLPVGVRRSSLTYLYFSGPSAPPPRVRFSQVEPQV